MGIWPRHSAFVSSVDRSNPAAVTSTTSRGPHRCGVPRAGLAAAGQSGPLCRFCNVPWGSTRSPTRIPRAAGYLSQVLRSRTRYIRFVKLDAFQVSTAIGCKSHGPGSWIISTESRDHAKRLAASSLSHVFAKPVYQNSPFMPLRREPSQVPISITST